MNPDRIYSQYRDDALAALVTAKEYSTFVAMPFGDRFSYRSREIYKDVIQAAATKANELKRTRRPFALPKRVDDGAATAVVITETIVKEILYSHLFVADLTFGNAGVLLETGIAMGLKSNEQIILITQGDVRDLHFDIRNNNVFSYNIKDAVIQIAEAMIAAANSFEKDADRRIESIKNVLTPDAILVLKFYGILQEKNGAAASLFRDSGKNIFVQYGARCEEIFEAASRELLEQKLLFTEYQPNAVPGADMFGMHATKLGCVFIGRMWPELAIQNPH
jgi:hypothetical protein